MQHMMKNTFYDLKSQYISLKDYKENPSKYKFRLACRAYSFQSPTCTKANHPYILSPYNRDDDRTVAMVEP